VLRDFKFELQESLGDDLRQAPRLLPAVGENVDVDGRPNSRLSMTVRMELHHQSADERPATRW
jgi:hypothetical protein